MPNTTKVRPRVCVECGSTFYVPVQRGRQHTKCETHRGATVARRDRVQAAKSSLTGPGTIPAPAVQSSGGSIADLIPRSLARAAVMERAESTGDPVADALAAAHAASEALAAAVAEREAAQAAQAANVRPVMPTPEGAHYAFDDLLLTLRAGEQPYLCGPSGSGKSHAAGQAAEILGLSFRFMSCSPTIGGHVFFGYMSATGTYVPGIIREAWTNGGVVLIDEIDACNSQALVELNGALALTAGKCFTFPDGASIPRHDDFLVIAAGNTTGHGADDTYNGREPLDGASLTRFVMIEWGYDETLERAMVPAEHVSWAERVQTLRKAARAAGESLLITPRATLAGARLLAVGMPVDKVERMTIWKGCPDDTRQAVLAHA